MLWGLVDTTELMKVDDESFEDIAEKELEVEILLDVACVVDDRIGVASSTFVVVGDSVTVSADDIADDEYSLVDVNNTLE